MHMRVGRSIRTLLFFILAGAPLWAQAGPPFQTDDPVPVDYGHYEAYIFGTVDGTPAELDPVAPAFEFNWGAVPNIQLHAILPFGAVFIELFFIMSSIWMGRVYYVFGFLFVVLLLLVIVCAEVSLVLTYMHLCVEDWKWWWKWRRNWFVNWNFDSKSFIQQSLKNS